MSNIPKWLELQAEIDMRYWMLEKMLKDSKSRAPIEKMIDEATDYNEMKIEEAKILMQEIDELKKQYYKVVPEWHPNYKAQPSETCYRCSMMSHGMYCIDHQPSEEIEL